MSLKVVVGNITEGREGGIMTGSNTRVPMDGADNLVKGPDVLVDSRRDLQGRRWRAGGRLPQQGKDGLTGGFRWRCRHMVG